MGALAPVSPWIPEDDLLLKNAIEAGASLESLAKGAVQFSRRFTVRELQERWHSLLYDPVISTEAASRMIECEGSGSTLPSRFDRAGNSKENKCVPGKRKTGSVRSCYYAMCKRICSEPFTSMDSSFLVGPDNCNFIRNDEGALYSNNFVLEESNLDIMHFSFPRIGDEGATHAYHQEFDDVVQEDYQIEQDNMPEDIPPLPGENLFNTTELQMNSDPVLGCPMFDGSQIFSSPIPECGTPFHNLEYSTQTPEMPIWEMVEGIPEPGIPMNLGLNNDLHARDSFSLPDASDTQDAFSSRYGVVPADSNFEGEMPNNVLNDATGAGEGFLSEVSDSLLNFMDDEEMNIDGGNVNGISYYDHLSSLLLNSPNDDNEDVIPNISEQELSVPPDYVTNQTDACPGVLEEGRGSHCSVDAVGSHCSVDAVGSHYNVDAVSSHYSVDAVCDSEVTVLTCASVSNSHYNVDAVGSHCSVDAVGSHYSVDAVGSHHNVDAVSPHCSVDAVCDSEVTVLTCASVSNSQFPELTDGIICCTLNTEDPEIPSNDDVVFPQHLRKRSFSSISQWTSQNPGKSNSSFVKELSRNLNAKEGSVLTKRELEIPGQFLASSHLVPEIDSILPVVEHGLKSEFPSSDSTHRGTGCPHSGKETFVPGKLNEETTETALLKHLDHNTDDTSIEKPDFGSDGHYPLSNPGCAKHELVDSARTQNQASLAGPEQLVNHSESDPEDLDIESDDDVPYFSDIEAMILDMDLDPDHQDLWCSEKVARYQHEDTRTAIMRLEQGAQSYMQRAIARHGAFAIMYGRQSKHYIKKPEVLLGRATEDVIVDIDLGRERRGSKISRRQASITLEESGSFNLKNLGKSSILVNGKDLAPGQTLGLTSSCLIEIRGMPFIFETNQTCVKQYLDSTGHKNPDPEHQV